MRERGGAVRRVTEVSAPSGEVSGGWGEGGTALEAAAGIHTDLAKGFIRAETFTVADIVRLGSERELKAAGLMRQEPKDYVIQDGDVITIKHNA